MQRVTNLLQATVRRMLCASHGDSVLGGQSVVHPMVLRWTSVRMAHLLAHDGVLGVALQGCVLPVAVVHQALGRGALHGDPLSDLHSKMLEGSTIEPKLRQGMWWWVPHRRLSGPYNDMARPPAGARRTGGQQGLKLHPDVSEAAGCCRANTTWMTHPVLEARCCAWHNLRKEPRGLRS